MNKSSSKVVAPEGTLDVDVYNPGKVEDIINQVYREKKKSLP